MKVIGLMSGTSGDGIDAAVVEIRGAPPNLTADLLSFTCVPFEPQQRARVMALFDGSAALICEMNFVLGEWFAGAAARAVEQAGLSWSQIDLIGSHGQTVYHLPRQATLQIGEAAVIAQRTGITTVADFRVTDIAAGGEGAPLVSYVDWLLLRHPTVVRAVQNIGGIANVTYLPPGDDPAGTMAFDSGPGNMLIDDAAARVTGGAWSFDRNGALARQGRVDEALLAELMAHPYLAASPPKTTGRELFGASFAAAVWEQAQARKLTGPDLVATLTAFTAASIADAYRRFLPRLPEQVILGGGGASNPVLVEMLRQRLAPAEVTTHEAVGMSSDAKEAVAFAVLAYEAFHGRPGNLPACTGARAPVILGKIVPGRNDTRLYGPAGS